MATGSATGASVVDVDDVGTTSVAGEDSAEDNGTYEVVDDISGAYVVLISVSVAVSIGSGLFGNPLQSTRYG